MAEYIEKQAVIKALEMHWNGMVLDVFDFIRNLPSADVQPVRHGHWIHDGFDIPHGVDWMHCSECGNRDVYCPAAMTDYCPNCGARMDGDTDG